jgi:ribonucleotide reductase alpha subunit
MSLREDLISKKAGLTENARVVLAKRYLRKDDNGNVIETPEELFFRVAENIASIEKKHDVEKWTRKFYDMMANLDFLPNSPTLMNAGRDIQQLSACFVLPIGDSITEIFDAIKWTALIHQSGGGTGFTFSNLRPAGDLVKSTKGVSSGPISFMKVFDAATGAICQGGTRRGANMGLLRCDHPDIMEFISVKEKDGVLANFNISVAITKQFMDALDKNEEYPLINPRSKKVVKYIKASEVFEKIVDSAWRNGEPGILFIDEINAHNPTPHIGELHSVNPCLTGETLVAVADGRGSVTIKQLAEEGKDIPVYCKDSDNKIVISMMRNPRITSESAEIYKVTLDDGNVIRATANHEILLSSGKLRRVSDLKYGDSLHIFNKKAASFHDVIEKCQTASLSKYYWVGQKPEHRMIYEFYNGRIPKDCVIHHINYDSKDNRIENLRCMTVKEHNDIHRKDKIGDKNPMRRAKNEWSKEKWKKYHDNMSKAVSGEDNGRFSGISNDKLFEKAVELSKRNNRKLSIHEWEEYALKNGYPSQFSKFRTEVFGTVVEFLDKAAIAAEVQGAGLRNAETREFNKFLQLKESSDLDLFFEDNVIKVRKNCEGCGQEFIVSYSVRETGYCSLSCANKNREITEDDLRKRKIGQEKIREKKRIQQINAFNDLKLEIGRIPMKKEYAEYCKKRGVPFRLPVKRELKRGILIGTFNNWEDLKEKAVCYNHRVVSVTKLDEREPVYNGTVDVYHNFYFGGFKSIVDGKEIITFTNGKNCGEQPLLTNESCNLGSINLLSVLVDRGGSYVVDQDKLGRVVHTAVRFLDNVIEKNKYPLPQIDEMTKSNRKIGLGVMGFADALIKLGIPYNSPEAISTAETVMKFIQDEGRWASIELAKERGPFPNFKGSIFDKGPKVRNATVTTIAPTGTLSMIASCSSGVEPLFALVYEKNVMDGKKFMEVHPEFVRVAKERGIYSEELIKTVHKVGSVKDLDIPEDLKKIFVTAHDVTPLDHISIQAAFQKYTDNAVSKTVNFSHDATKKDVEDVYKLAYKTGCKGVTVYRDGSRSGQVLTVGSTDDAKTENTVTVKDFESGDVIAKEIKLPKIFDNGPTHIIKKEDKKFYLHFSYLPDDLKKKYPICIWIHTNHKYGASELRVCNLAAQSLQKLAQASGINKKFIKGTLEKANSDYPHNRLGRMVSLCLRHGLKREDILVALTGIEGDNVSTLLTAVRKFLSKTLDNGTKLAKKCPECKSQIYMENGCMTCKSCGWSAC